MIGRRTSGWAAAVQSTQIFIAGDPSDAHRRKDQLFDTSFSSGFFPAARRLASLPSASNQNGAPSEIAIAGRCIRTRPRCYDLGTCRNVRACPEDRQSEIVDPACTRRTLSSAGFLFERFLAASPPLPRPFGGADPPQAPDRRFLVSSRSTIRARNSCSGRTQRQKQLPGLSPLRPALVPAVDPVHRVFEPFFEGLAQCSFCLSPLLQAHLPRCRGLPIECRQWSSRLAAADAPASLRVLFFLLLQNLARISRDEEGYAGEI